jgi:hypothetical protein
VTPRRPVRLLLAAAVLGLGAGVAAPAVAAPGPAAAPRSAAAAGSAVTRTETVTRDHLIDGNDKVVDRRRVTLRVSATRNLYGRQGVDVSWSGAHPTGGIVSDVNSIDAQQEEYPFVLLECRGLDGSKVPAHQRLSPETCWTQGWSERYQDTYGTQFPPYRMDRYATPAQRRIAVGVPKKLPKACNYLSAPTQHWVPFVAADGHVYDGGPQGCGGMAPESQSVGGAALPSNETFGVTGKDGRGSAQFDIWTSAENASLGCSQQVACSLVAIPIMGISCDAAGQKLPAGQRPGRRDAAAAEKLCTRTGHFAPGQLVQPQNQEDLAVSGALWWSASNWRNRISVPLSFSPPSDACDVVSTDNSVSIYGSEPLIQATTQWAPHFCLNSKLFKFTHVQTGEPEARTLLDNGSIEAAFTSGAPPGGYQSRPVVSSPVAVSGFAISYVIDGADGQPYTRLRLDPRLLAKLLTESYPAELPVQQEDAALSHNPLNITLDPEFQKLNPGIPHGVDASEAAAALLAVNSDSDTVEALTSYIDADPAARAWLDGKPDRWGMRVNPKYKGIKLPVDRWPLLDTFEPKKWYASDNNDCLYHNPEPYLPLVAAPLATLEEVTEALQFSIAQSDTVCSQIDGTTVGEKLVGQGRQPQGYRFMIGLTTVPEAQRYGLRTAALLTNHGRYVAPDKQSMAAAVRLLHPDEHSGVWSTDYAGVVRDPSDETAYPGTMVVYLAVPTSGLPKQDAADFAQLMRFAATRGQRPGLEVGDLPPGYLPMTKADGLAPLVSYADVAAAAVAAQKGATPALVAATSGHGTSGSRAGGASTANGAGGGAASGGTGAPAGVAGGGGSPTSATAAHSAGASSASTAADQKPVVASPATGSVARTVAFALGGGALVLLLCLALGLFGGVGAGAAYLVGRVKGRW